MVGRQTCCKWVQVLLMTLQNRMTNATLQSESCQASAQDVLHCCCQQPQDLLSCVFMSHQQPGSFVGEGCATCSSASSRMQVDPEVQLPDPHSGWKAAGHSA